MTIKWLIQQHKTTKLSIIDLFIFETQNRNSSDYI